MKSGNLIYIAGFLLMLSACAEGGSEYAKLVSKEMKSGVVHDHIFFGLNFGDTDKEFFGKSWDLNKEGKVTHGPKNMNIKYMTKDGDGKEIMVLFYPKFDADRKIKQMDFEFSYLGWSPWTTELFPDKLIPVVKDTLMEWFPGNSFMELEINEEQYWGKIDGNRRIALKMDGDKAVLAKIFDMNNVENKLN